MKSHTASTVLLPVLLAATASALPGAVPLPRGTDGIQWGDCEQPTGGLPVQCGKLNVPLDWSDKSSNKTMITLELIKYPAKTQPAPKGSILLNFGGPGQDGLNNFIAYYPLQSPIIGDEYDILSWDPRGTRNTIPFYCWEPDSVLASQFMGYGNTWWNTSDISPAQLWSETSVVADLCYGKHNATGSFMGMAAVSHDMMAIVDALDEDGMLRYWGISGGTILGATVAAMYPDRMDKVIIDGVLNPNEYYNSPIELEWNDYTDDTFTGVLEACLEVGPEKCALANQGSTLDELVAVWEQLIVDMKFNPLPWSIPSLEAGGFIEYNSLMYYVHQSLYRPRGYQNLTAAIDALVRRDALTWLTLTLDLTVPDPNAPTDPAPATLAVFGIRCGDKQTDADELSDFYPWVDKSKKKSKWFYGFGLGVNALLCGQWKMPAKERYSGPFENIKTSNPLLVIGNRFDPVTPITSAKNISAGFEDSYLLEINSFGHTSIVRGSESDCAFDVIKGYLADGSLPKEAKVCETNKKLTEIWGA
jgi:pimeloyl-ACP methyl ester carboxylesterase